MRILLLALTVGTMAVAGCTTEDGRLADPNGHKNSDQDYSTNSYKNSYNSGGHNTDASHYAPGGYGAVGPDGTSVPNPSAANPLNPQSDNSILQK